MFIYHGCDNLKHPFPTSLVVQEFSQLSSLFLKMFRFPALLISYGISFHILITLALQKVSSYFGVHKRARDLKASARVLIP